MLRTLFGAALVLALLAVIQASHGLVAADTVRDAAAEAAPLDADEAFGIVARVLRHPRCLNCHPSGDRPRVGDAALLHGMNVQRGPKDEGMAGLHCDACHHDANQDLAGVPGAPHWKLAPRSQGWEGLDDHDLAEALKDPERNGGRDLAAMLEHVAHDDLVGYGWKPLAGFEPVPITRKRFVEAFRAWIEADAPSPHPGITTR